MRNYLQNRQMHLLTLCLLLFTITNILNAVNAASKRTGHPIAVAPVITQGPASQTLCANSDITFSIEASGATTYQWQVNMGTGFTDLAGLAPYSGANTASLKITNVPSYGVKSASGSNPYTLSRENVDSGIFAVANEAVLPVRLVNFKANRESQSVVLDWQTADAVNVSHFEVEKSRNGKAFTSIWNELYIEGKHTYRAIDPTFAADGSVYYRLKMVDSDATFAYSSIVHVQAEPLSSEVLFGSPNPFINKINVQVSSTLPKNSNLTLTNILGQNIPIKNIERSHNEVSIEIDHALPSGSYLLRIQDEKMTSSIKLLKQ